MGLGILCSVFFGVRYRFRIPELFILAVVAFAVDGVLGLRRALLLSESCLIFRPPVGSLVIVPLHDIVSVQRTVTAGGWTVLFGPRRAPGIRIVTVGGYPFVFPLSVEDSEELMANLEKAVSTR